jgi:DNA primase
VIFPIRDVTGKLIAFGGRLVDGEGAKYINSPENELYSKRRSLYLIDKARRAIVERRRSILVEGYMDAIRLHLAGFTETVASLGTALTEDQAAILGRLADRCYICYDADLSGQEATLKGMYLLQRSGLDVHVVTLPSAKDPDEFLQQEDGPEAFGKVLAEAKPLLAYHLALRRKAFRDRQRRRGAVEELLEGLLSLPLLEVASYLPEIASAMAVTPRQLQEVLEERRKSLSLVETSRERGGREIGPLSFPGRGEGICPLSNVPTDKEDQERADPWEEILCWLLWNDESLRERADLSTVLPLLRDPLASSIICALLGGETPDELTVRWLQAGETRAQALLASGGDRCERLPRDGSLWTLALRELESRRLKEEYERLKIRMTANEASASDVVRYYELAGKLKGGKVT